MKIKMRFRKNPAELFLVPRRSRMPFFRLCRIVFCAVTMTVSAGGVGGLVEHPRLFVGLLFAADVKTEDESEEAEGGGLVHVLNGREWSRFCFTPCSRIATGMSPWV